MQFINEKITLPIFNKSVRYINEKITLSFSFSYFFQALQGSLSGLNTDGNKIDIQPNKTEIKVGLQFILTV